MTNSPCGCGPPIASARPAAGAHPIPSGSMRSRPPSRWRRRRPAPTPAGWCAATPCACSARHEDNAKVGTVTICLDAENCEAADLSVPGSRRQPLVAVGGGRRDTGLRDQDPDDPGNRSPGQPHGAGAGVAGGVRQRGAGAGGAPDPGPSATRQHGDRPERHCRRWRAGRDGVGTGAAAERRHHAASLQPARAQRGGSICRRTSPGSTPCGSTPRTWRGTSQRPARSP